jgi:nitronate monooxygenase
MVPPMTDSPFPPLRLRGRDLLPLVQGGMGVGISAHQLAGAVAAKGGVGTIASVDLRRLHPDLMETVKRSRDPDAHSRANLTALDREIRRARALAGGAGLIAVNVMRALRDFAAHVRQACVSGADAIVMGAGLPLELPDLTSDYPDVALIPIVSDVRAARIVLKRWARKGRLPDALVVENPRHAGGHLGVSEIGEWQEPRFAYEEVLPAIREALTKAGPEAAAIPLIAAGGINSHERLTEVLELGADAAQVGTPFAVTREGDAHPAFKRVLAESDPAETVTFVSAAGLPARAVRTPWLERYLGLEDKLRERADPACASCPTFVECLDHCGFKDGKECAGQFCIETRLAAAQAGKVRQGLFFRGAASLPFGNEIRPVADLMRLLLTGSAAAPAQPTLASR